jgi:diguanylate cyclase (GGDEF)-like protein
VSEDACGDGVSSEGLTSGGVRPASRELSRGLLHMYAAPTSGALADALQSLVAPSIGATMACIFLDDGSGVLTPLTGEGACGSGLSDINLGGLERGFVADVLEHGEMAVSDRPNDILGKDVPSLPARRIMLCRLAWEEEKLGVVLFGDGGDGTDLELFLEVAQHVSLALIRLRALKRVYRYGGIDPTRWMFEQEWFKARLEEEAERAKRYGRPLALLLFILQNVEDLAERGRRQQKDVFLRRVAAVIRGEIRSPDVLAAYGDAGIAVLLPETERAAAVATQARIASRLLQLRPTNADIAGWRPGLLIGAAACPGDGDSAGALIAAAESSLSRAEDEEPLEKTA